MGSTMLAVEPPNDSVNYGLNLMYVIIVLAVIVVLIIGLIRFLGTKNKSWFSNPMIRILGGVGLGPNKTLQVIEIGNVVYLVGVGEDISLIDKISDRDEVATILAALQDDAVGNRNLLSPFINKLVRKIRRVETPLEVEVESDISFHEVFDSKIRRMSNRKDKMEELLREDNNTDRLRDL
ncbi:flagellar biosynthetic protein FliO [Paenibacillus crassostreae]|uniref:Flagellar protein n=1 Tax=Paenibacillus crassostreae TaxID=1763538 RepID=A0A167FN84_9BACL|nr:flagellar biosynthetic protein FliO [Paenibacillus crassostreae]AOZ94232.1 flagellar protein [Paenibacillus crassostreae]OAB76732.1 flagellar protein [Paenibacillus crassostreae]